MLYLKEAVSFHSLFSKIFSKLYYVFNKKYYYLENKIDVCEKE